MLDRNTLYYLSKVGDHSRGWPEGSLFNSLLHEGVGEGATPFPGLLHFTLDPYLIMLSVKQRGIKYHFLSFWYDSIWDWTHVSRATLTARPMSGTYFSYTNYCYLIVVAFYHNISQGKFSRYDTKLHLIVRLQFLSSGESGVTPFLPLLSGSL